MSLLRSHRDACSKEDSENLGQIGDKCICKKTVNFLLFFFVDVKLRECRRIWHDTREPPDFDHSPRTWPTVTLATPVHVLLLRVYSGYRKDYRIRVLFFSPRHFPSAPRFMARYSCNCYIIDV